MKKASVGSSLNRSPVWTNQTEAANKFQILITLTVPSLAINGGRAVSFFCELF